jgi:hypothetical protein
MPAPNGVSDSTAETSESRPSSNSAEMASMSEVCLEITRPEV